MLVTVVSPDADIFVVLLYHLRNTWPELKLFVMRKGQIKVDKRRQNEIDPVNILVEKMGGKVVDQLPAGHSLTGCDTVAKVGTKLAMIRTLTSQRRR